MPTKPMKIQLTRTQNIQRTLDRLTEEWLKTEREKKLARQLAKSRQPNQAAIATELKIELERRLGNAGFHGAVDRLHLAVMYA